MKNFKKIFTFLLGLIVVATACTEDDKPEVIVYGDAELVSFGFYVEDNPNVILKDYVVESIEGKITIKLPAEVDKTSLVARFEVSTDDVVTVAGVTQVSQTTPNDFSVPVDYLVTEGTNNTKYTIVIENAEEGVWTPLPSFVPENGIKYITMGVNSVDGSPYLAYSENDDDKKMSVVKYDGSVWAQVGSTDFTDDQFRYPTINFSGKGVPYVAFADYSIEKDGKTNSAASVMRYENGAWGYVGNKGVTDVKIAGVCLGFDAEDNVHAFSTLGVDGNYGNKREVVESVFLSDWQSSAIPNRPETQARILATKNINGALYLAVLNFGDGQSFSVYKYANSEWSTIAEQMKDDESDIMYYYPFDIDVDNKGNVYIAYAEDKGADKNYTIRLRKYDATAQTWSRIGDEIVAYTRVSDLNVTPLGKVMLIYKTPQKYPAYRLFDNETNNWSSEELFESAECSTILSGMTNTGVGYVYYKVGDDVKILKYDTPE